MCLSHSCNMVIYLDPSEYLFKFPLNSLFFFFFTLGVRFSTCRIIRRESQYDLKRKFQQYLIKDPITLKFSDIFQHFFYSHWTTVRLTAFWNLNRHVYSIQRNGLLQFSIYMVLKSLSVRPCWMSTYQHNLWNNYQ